MLLLISPAKSFDFQPSITKDFSEPRFLDQSTRLIKKMRSFSCKKLGEIMNISPELARINHTRYQNWSSPQKRENSKQAILAFNGEVYRGIKAKDMSEEELQFAQSHLRILSGLYGVLRPLDNIQAYRLEMGTKFTYYNYKNLYQFWGDKITKSINEELSKYTTTTLINLASSEYYKSVKSSLIKGKIITPIFKDFSNGEYKTLMTYAKNARGLMTNYIIKNRITDPTLIKSFNINGYAFSASQSNKSTWVFLRG